MAPSNLDNFWVQGLNHRPDVITLPIAINIIVLPPYGVPKATGPKTDMNSELCKTTPGKPLEHDEGSSMRILRFFLLLASVVGAAYIFHALHAGTFPSVERSIAWLFGLEWPSARGRHRHPKRPDRSIRSRGAGQHGRCLDRDLRRQWAYLSSTKAAALLRLRTNPLCLCQIGHGAILLPARSARLPRYLVFQRSSVYIWRLRQQQRLQVFGSLRHRT